MTKEQTKQFVFSEENLAKSEEILVKYPNEQKKSAVLPLLDLAQRQNNNWLSVPVIEYVAELIEQPYMRVYEVASFYSMFNLKPVGKYHIQLCGTTPCWLAGSDKIKESFEKHTKTSCGSTSKDDLFTITEVECLGACRNAPLVQINDDFHEDLNEERVQKIVEDLRNKQ